MEDWLNDGFSLQIFFNEPRVQVVGNRCWYDIGNAFNKAGKYNIYQLPNQPTYFYSAFPMVF